MDAAYFAKKAIEAVLGGDVVGITALLALLAGVGRNTGHPADLDDDGVVGIVDQLQLLAARDPCP